MADPPNAPDEAQELQPGVRAARERLGLSQRQVAERMGVVLGTYCRWDRNETKPREPEKVLLLAEVLKTPPEILFPPDDNPHVAHTRASWRTAEASAAAPEPLFGDESSPGPEVATDVPSVYGGAPHEGTAPGGVPKPVDVAALITRPPRRRPRGIVVAAALTAAAVAAGVAIALPGDPVRSPTEPTGAIQNAAVDAPLPVDAEARARLAAANERGDYRAAIAIAARLGDPGAARTARIAATDVLLDRAERAVRRGRVREARRALTEARTVYGDQDPGRASVLYGAIHKLEAQRAANARHRAANRHTIGDASAASGTAPPASTTTSQSRTSTASKQRTNPDPSSQSSSSGGGGGANDFPQFSP